MAVKYEPVYYCDKCKHGPWLRRKDRMPLICPKCKTKFWNGPRKR